MKKLLILLAVLMSLSLLIGCGGGGGSSSGSDPSPEKIEAKTITGIIMDSNYNYVEGINVALYNKASDDPIHESVTQEGGVYTFKNLPDGTYKILAYSDDYDVMSNESKYEKYTLSKQGVSKNIIVKDTAMNKSAKTDILTFKGDKGSTKIWTPDNTSYTTTDGRGVNTIYFENNKAVNDTHDFNMFVKFTSGSISLITGTRNGSTITITREVPICNYNLENIKKGTFKASVDDGEIVYISNVGSYVVFPTTVTSSNPMFTTSYYKVSPEFGWFVEYNNDGETFKLSN